MEKNDINRAILFFTDDAVWYNPKGIFKGIKELKEYISKSEGSTSVRIIVNNGNENKSVLLEKRVDMNSETKRWLRKF